MTNDFYAQDEYIEHNPNLHQEDSAWKISKILPLVDRLMKEAGSKRSPFRILDVGGGAGLILKSVAQHVNDRYGLETEKYALDLSPGMLKVQQANNPDMKAAYPTSITKTDFPDNHFDLLLMIDVLEHIPEPAKALEEIRRIARYAIYKVPLEDCLAINLLDRLQKGAARQRAFETVGHVNFYNAETILSQLKEHGSVVSYGFTDVFGYFLKSGHSKGARKAAHALGFVINKISPRLASRIINDFLVALVKYE